MGASGAAVAPFRDRISSEPTSAIARVMAKTRSDRNRANPARPPQPHRSDLSGLSVLGRFNSLIFDFVSLFVGFISLFDRVGNLHSGGSQYQGLADTDSVA